jgi:small subunit ribosomal protein S17e
MMKRIQKGPVKGISLKLQEEVRFFLSIKYIIFQERERKMDFIPERSELQVDNLELRDKIVREMVKEIGLKKLIPGKKRE